MIELKHSDNTLENELFKSVYDKTPEQSDWIYAHELVYTLLYEIVGSRTVCFLILNQRYPKGASYSAHLDVGIEFGYLQIITLTLDGAFGGQHAHMTTLGEMTNNLGSGTNDAQHTAHGI